MKEQITPILQLAEKATMLYAKYLLENEDSWSEEEKETAKTTLGGLTVLCHQMKQELNAGKEYTEQEKFALDYELKRVEVACTTILSHLE